MGYKGKYDREKVKKSLRKGLLVLTKEDYKTDSGRKPMQ